MARVKPKKHLGQHFLKDEQIAHKITSSLANLGGDRVIEIGAGTGVLTKYLLSEYNEFVAFDVDPESIQYLQNQYAAHASKFILRDYLKYILHAPAVLIGNFPYNISSQLFFKVWEDRDRVSEVVCMIQKEVADRICAPHGNKTYGILSVLLGAFFDIAFLFEVPPHMFDPPPKVQSAVIRLTRNDVKALPCNEDRFKKIVKAGFGQRRKTLRNALKHLDLPHSEHLDGMLSRRAEQLSVDDFINLTSIAEKGWKM